MIAQKPTSSLTTPNKELLSLFPDDCVVTLNAWEGYQHQCLTITLKTVKAFREVCQLFINGHLTLCQQLMVLDIQTVFVKCFDKDADYNASFSPGRSLILDGTRIAL